MRKAFNFYNSYYATFDDLTDAQIGQLMRELTKVQFMDKHIDDVFFKDKMVLLVWKSIKHSILEQIKGYCSKRSIAYESVFPNPTQGVDKTSATPTLQEKEKEKEKEKGKGKEQEQYVKQKFSFTLPKKQSYDNLSKEYKAKLKAKCLITDGDIDRYESFITSLEAGGYQYKDFSKTYMAWDKDKAYKRFTPKRSEALGDEWVEIKVGDGKVLGINTETYEIRSGTLRPKEIEQQTAITSDPRRSLRLVTNIAKEM